MELDDEKTKEISRLLYQEMVERQEFMSEHFPSNPPNSKCYHAIMSGIHVENSFEPRLHDYVPFLECENEKVYIWTHTENRNSSFVVEVSEDVKELNFWKNIGYIIQLAYSYCTSFESLIEVEYNWCYHFSNEQQENDLVVYGCSNMDIPFIFNGTIIKATEIYDILPLIELLVRDEKIFTATSLFYSSMKLHHCCLICELERTIVKKHVSHEPEIWEQASVISDYETAIVQSCRCVEALLGKPPNSEKQNSYLRHKNKWIEEIGIDPEENFKKANKKFIDFYYDLFELRNSSAHSYGSIPFELERKQTIEAQCFASEILDAYIMKNILSKEEASENLNLNIELLNRVKENMSTPITYKSDK